MEKTPANAPSQFDPQTGRLQQVLYAKDAAAGVTIGVVVESEPSNLTLLALGIAGMAERDRRRERLKQAGRQEL